MDGKRTYVAIDLKSFFASVECVDRGLDPLTTNLVVADITRTEKTICLAVTPSLKSYGISGRARLFEVIQQVKKINNQRRQLARRALTAGGTDNLLVQKDPSVALDYIVAPPQMARYMEVSNQIFKIYLKYISAEDLQVYSIDEIFADVTDYLKIYSCTAHELAMRMIRDVLANTGITATAGIGSNLYLAKVAMDIHAKHQPADCDGVRIAELDEYSYRRELWNHKPLSSFWRVGRGIASRLEAQGIDTMGELARRSLDKNWEAWLFKQFGVNAELLIDHAWGREPCTMKEIKTYRPQTSSISTGQVLHMPYDFKKGLLIVREMADQMSLDLVAKGLKTDQLVLAVGYDVESLKNYSGELVSDWYGRAVPKPAHGSINLGRHTSSSELITKAAAGLYNKIVSRGLLVRRVNITANHLISAAKAEEFLQQSLFEDNKDDERELRRQKAILKIKEKYGKNAILKGMNFEEGATARDRNSQIGGHKA